MAQIAVALVHLGLVLTSLTGLLEVGILVEASITSFFGDCIETRSKLFSSFKTGSSTLDVALNGFEVVLRREATSCISSSHNGRDDGFHR